ncbi:hypothetical protein [Paenibacillus sp. N3.4]|nr:hypothetical protein [Paenibacillus sp. N3.4]
MKQPTYSSTCGNGAAVYSIGIRRLQSPSGSAHKKPLRTPV